MLTTLIKNKTHNHRKPKVARHPRDNKMLIIETIEQFSYWAQKDKLNIHGITLDLGLSDEQLNALAASLNKTLQDPSPNYAPTDTPRHDTKARAYKFNNNSDIRSILIEDNTPEEIIELACTLTDIYKKHATTTLRRTSLFDGTPPKGVLQLRSNVTQTPGYHCDTTDTIILAFNHLGPIINNAKAKTKEHLKLKNEYAISAGNITLIDPTLWHKTPEPTLNWDHSPRATIII